jgi:predicted MPP superfamily phosphohydrolase
MNQTQAFITFILAVLTISGLLHWFLYARLVVALNIVSPNVLWSLRFLAGFLAVSFILARMLDTFAPRPLVLAFEGFASVWIGLMFQLLWITIDLWILKLLLKLTGVWGRLPHEAVGKVSVLVVVAVAMALCTWATVIAQRPARVVKVHVPVKGITPELRQMKIAVVADFHAGLLVSKSRVERWVYEINRLEPDVILIPGDVIDRPPHRMMEYTDAFRKLKAPLGVYVSTGNHEYFVGLNNAIKFFKAANMRVLINDVDVLPCGLLIAAVEDKTASMMKRLIPSMSELLGDSVKDHPTILMNHTPSTRDAREATAMGVDLMVSGHTHGGQMWPFSYFSRRAFPLHHGLYPVNDGYQLTTCGIGTWGPPMRLGASPEILLIHFIGKDEPAMIK